MDWHARMHGLCLQDGKGATQLLTSNIGDARIVMVKSDGTAVQLSEDHVPDKEEERYRIESMNPNPKLPLVRYQGGTWRVGGLLALSRAFGNAYLKGSLQFEGVAAGSDGYSSGFGLIAEPYTTLQALTGEGRRLPCRTCCHDAWQRGCACTALLLAGHRGIRTSTRTGRACWVASCTLEWAPMCMSLLAACLAAYPTAPQCLLIAPPPSRPSCVLRLLYRRGCMAGCVQRRAVCGGGARRRRRPRQHNPSRHSLRCHHHGLQGHRGNPHYHCGSNGQH